MYLCVCVFVHLFICLFMYLYLRGCHHHHHWVEPGGVSSTKLETLQNAADSLRPSGGAMNYLRLQSIIFYSIQRSTPAKTLNGQERECAQLGICQKNTSGSTFWPRCGPSGQLLQKQFYQHFVPTLNCIALQNMRIAITDLQNCDVSSVLKTGRRGINGSR